MAGTDFSHLTNDELIKGIKALDLPDYIRSKAYGVDVRETLAQMTEMTIQLGVNMGLSPDEALKWARKLQESVSQSEFDSWVATLLDGGPSIFMNTLNELKTTYPNGASGVALVRETDPAKIYVWNGSAWESFGDYQGIEIKDGTVTSSKIADDAITSSKTNFLTLDTTKNLFDGNFKPFNLSGTGTYTLTEDNSHYGVLIDVKPNTSYSLDILTTLPDFVKIATAKTKVSYGNLLDGGYSALLQSTQSFPTAILTRPEDRHIYIDFYSKPDFVKIVESEIKVEIEDGETYPIVPNKENLSVYSIDEVDDKLNNIEAEQVNFLGSTGNLFDGNFLKDKALKGDPGALTLASENGTGVACIPIKPNTTYSVLLDESTINADGYYYFKIGTDTRGYSVLVNATENTALNGSASRTITKEDTRVYTFTSGVNDQSLLVQAGKGKTQYVEVVEGVAEKVVFGTYDKVYTLANNIVNVENLKQKQNIVWFGDSLSALRQLPHRVADLTNNNITDVSFAGAVMTNHSNAMYMDMGVKSLTEQIIAKDFSKLDAAIELRRQSGYDVDKAMIPNSNNLKNVDWAIVDAVVILAGTNDFGGSEAPILDFENGISEIINNLSVINNSLEVYFITPPYRGDKQSNAHSNLTDYVDSTIKVVGEYGYPVFDFYRGSNVNQLNIGTFLNEDKLHQNDTGDALWANKISKFIKSN